jgi:predicted RNA-binding Zn-ribbon protein involved in translation (DUF1610 family)
MNILHPTEHYFAFQDGFLPVKILAGEYVFERLAPQRTSIIFGINDLPWAPAAYRINDLIVQLEPNLNKWDSIAIEGSGKARLVRHNTVIYELQSTIPPDITGLHSNFFYRCPECNRHIYQCRHLLIGHGNLNQSASTSANREPTASKELGNSTCPNCGGKIQHLAPGVSFCLDCDWEYGLTPIN